MSDDPTRDFPWANAILLLLYPYKPYPKDVPISGYYPASNRAYHAVTDLLRYFEERNIRAERAALPVRETLLRHRIGIACKNGLTAVMPFGTRFSAQMLALDVPEALLQHRMEISKEPYRTCPENCDRCLTACPSNAISSEGMQYADCIRADMDGQCMQERTIESLNALIGCERCQFACPLNAAIEVETAIPEAFSFERILRGNVKEAYELIGKNMKSSARLEQHAIILSAKHGRTDLLPLIETFVSNPRPHIAQAAEYAISVLRKTKE